MNLYVLSTFARQSGVPVPCSQIPIHAIKCHVYVGVLYPRELGILAEYGFLDQRPKSLCKDGDIHQLVNISRVIDDATFEGSQTGLVAGRVVID
jgi:hypothetical protein